MLHEELARTDDGESELDGDQLEDLSSAVDQIAAFDEEPHGEEFFSTLYQAQVCLQCKELKDVARLRDEFAPLLEINAPLRPPIIAVFRRFRNAAIDAASFLTAAHELTRRDALLQAQSALEEARALAGDVYEPERWLLLAVVEHWRRMFAREGGRVAERREVDVLPNPYVAGRPIRPEDGQLFVGRQREFEEIEAKLQSGVGIVIWGQQRIGKTSILLHLRERLPHHLLPVYLNLQTLMAQTTGGFLRAVAAETVKQLDTAWSPAFRRNVGKAANDQEPRRRSDDALIEIPPEGGTPCARSLPSAEEFVREPFLSFNTVLEEIERWLAPGQRVLLSFDEFEELERKVKEGKVSEEIFTYLRGVAQTGRRFSLLFAGLHTLKQMTHEYWNPFFQSVQTIRIGYLGELDARQLITDPMEQFPLAYDEAAIDRIIEVTRGHAYLMQNLCHELVNHLNDPLHRSNRATYWDVAHVLDKTIESSGYYFDDFVWGWSTPEERIALALLAEEADEHGEADYAVVEKHLGREAALVATQSLYMRDILGQRSAPRDDAKELVFRFEIPLARMWVQRTKPSARILLEGGRV